MAQEPLLIKDLGLRRIAGFFRQTDEEAFPSLPWFSVWHRLVWDRRARFRGSGFCLGANHRMAVATQTLARRYRISGRVQGVGFRYFVSHWATQLQIKGYVKNLADGDVEVYAVGSGVQLEGLREKLERGPTLARVTHFEEVAANIDAGFARFHIEGD